MLNAQLIWNHSPDYFLNCTPFNPITITNTSIIYGLIIDNVQLPVGTAEVMVWVPFWPEFFWRFSCYYLIELITEIVSIQSSNAWSSFIRFIMHIIYPLWSLYLFISSPPLSFHCILGVNKCFTRKLQSPQNKKVEVEQFTPMRSTLAIFRRKEIKYQLQSWSALHAMF